MYKLVAMDLDDTLLEKDKTVLSETADVLRRLYEKGIHIAISSGRILQTQMSVAKRFCEKASYVSYNGAVVVFEDGTKAEYYVPEDRVKAIACYCKEKGIYMQTYHNGLICTEYDSPELRADLDTMHTDVIELGDLSKADIPRTPKVVVITPPEDGDAVCAALAKEFPDLYVTRSSGMVIEIMPKGVDKAHGLSLVCEKLGLKSDDAIVFGDNYNDIGMVSWAGMGVAVANAVDDLKKIAGIVSKKERSAGVAEVLRSVFADIL